MKTKQKSYNGSLEMKIIPYILIAPNTIIFFCFIIIPALFGLYYSLTDWKGMGELDFVAFDNYIKAFSDTNFWNSVLNTCIYAIITLPLIMIIPLFIANLMIKEIKYVGIFRALFYWPSMIAFIVVGISFKFIFGDNTGVINYLLERINIDAIPWLTKETTAMLVVVLATVWCRTGFYMVMYISGLQSIPMSYYEAASVDGATGTKQFFSITLPLLKPTTFMVMMLGFVDLFKAYGLVRSLTNGGPGGSTKFIVQYTYDMAFQEMRMGYASALSMIMLAIMSVVTIVQFKVNKGGQVQ